MFHPISLTRALSLLRSHLFLQSQVAGHVQFLEDGLDEGEEEYKRVLRTDEEEEEAEKRLLSSKKVSNSPPSFLSWAISLCLLGSFLFLFVMFL